MTHSRPEQPPPAGTLAVPAPAMSSRDQARLPPDALARTLAALCPMHLVLDSGGLIRQAGATLRKLRPGLTLDGVRFLDLFEPLRPRAVSSLADLCAAPGGRLRVRFRVPPRTALAGMIVPLPDVGGAVVNLSFGIGLVDAVRAHGLTAADFAPTDLAIELLYLVEANAAAMSASRRLNMRLQGAMVAAERRAFTDTLTGLRNRRAMDHVLGRMIGAGMPFALMHLDLDHFKSVNDTLGHAAGDHVLRRAAREMVGEIRDRDMVARIGGDEFVLIFDSVTDRDRLAAIAGRLIARLESPIPWRGTECRISASIGIAFWPEEDAPDAATLLHRADLALYAAKRAGRGRFRFYDATMERAGLLPGQGAPAGGAG